MTTNEVVCPGGFVDCPEVRNSMPVLLTLSAARQSKEWWLENNEPKNLSEQGCHHMATRETRETSPTPLAAAKNGDRRWLSGRSRLGVLPSAGHDGNVAVGRTVGTGRRCRSPGMLTAADRRRGRRTAVIPAGAQKTASNGGAWTAEEGRETHQKTDPAEDYRWQLVAWLLHARQNSRKTPEIVGRRRRSKAGGWKGNGRMDSRSRVFYRWVREEEETRGGYTGFHPD
ncbi:hypothetical protein LXL04_028737 [Taraxacum kok-saghyz]